MTTISNSERSDRIRYTADVVAVVRFHEAEKKNPLVCDPFAHLFVSPHGEELLKSARARWPFFADYLIVRVKYFDDTVSSLCEKEAVEQIVIFGAGNDMRAVRLPSLQKRRVFEVDFPDRIAHKKDVLIKALKKLPENVVYVGADITHHNLVALLHRSGFVPGRKALIIMEGLIYYLRPAGVDHLFAELSCLPPVGNMFLIDHISRDMSRTSHHVEKRTRSPYPEDPLGYLKQKGFNHIESVFLGNLTGNYFGKRHPERWWAITCRK
jgi:methyltransferase (TIGR00027 family)